MGENLNPAETSALFARADLSWAPGRFRLTPLEDGAGGGGGGGAGRPDLCRDLGVIHHRNVVPCTLMERVNLHAEGAE